MEHYIDWTDRRINKIIDVMGEDFFIDASGLELGCLHGVVGAVLRDKFNCDMTFTDARVSNEEHFLKNNRKSILLILDQENEWNLNRQLDFVIHWGILYHLNNWQQDLKCTLEHSKVVFLESEVSDSLDPNFEIKAEESSNKNDQAFSGTGSRPSAAFIEKILDSFGAKWTRYDDEMLNSGFHEYDWISKDDRTQTNGRRRFWIIDNR